MVYIINSDCISCGACAGECLASAISDDADKYVIDPEPCTECGACASVCPVGAPNPEA